MQETLNKAILVVKLLSVKPSSTTLKWSLFSYDTSIIHVTQGLVNFFLILKC